MEYVEGTSTRASTPRSTRNVFHSRVREFAAFVAPLTLFLLAWSALATASREVPSPYAAGRAGIEWLFRSGFEISVQTGFGGRAGGLSALSVTMTSVATAIGVGLPIGFFLGLYLGSSKYRRDAVEPLVTGIQGVPKSIFYPVLLVVFGVSFWLFTTFAVLNVAFVTMLIIMGGVANVPPVQLRLARSLRLSALQRLRLVLLPSLTVPFLSALRLSISIAILSVSIMELIVARVGVGNAAMLAFVLGNRAELFGIALTMFVVSISLVLPIWSLERYFATRHGRHVSSGAVTI